MTEIAVDSQKAVDNKIKSKCEEFIEIATQLLISSLISLNNLAKVLQKENKLKSHQIFSSVDNFKNSNEEVINQLKTNLSLIKSKMSLYLANKDTEEILFTPIQVLFGFYYHFSPIISNDLLF